MGWRGYWKAARKIGNSQFAIRNLPGVRLQEWLSQNRSERGVRSPRPSKVSSRELWKKVEQLDKEIAEVRAIINRLNKIVRANIRQAVWQSITLFISRCIAVAGGLGYQTSVLNKRFAQMEKGWEESDRKFAERSKLSEENLKTYPEQSEKNRTLSDNLKEDVRARRK